MRRCAPARRSCSTARSRRSTSSASHRTSSTRSTARTSRRAARRRARLRGRPDDDEWRALVAGLQDQLDRAVTSAFSGPFLLAAALTLCALVPLLFLRRRRRETIPAVPRRARARRGRRRAVPRARRRRVRADPGRRSVRGARRTDADGLGETIERIALAASTESRASSVSRARISCSRCAARTLSTRAREDGIDRERREQAIADGLVHAVDQADEEGTLPGSSHRSSAVRPSRRRRG